MATTTSTVISQTDASQSFTLRGSTSTNADPTPAGASVSTSPTTSAPTTQQAQVPLVTEDEENIYDEIEIEDMTYDASMGLYHYPCPCGDRFEIYVGDMRDGTDIAICPGCSLTIRVIFDQGDLPEEEAKEQDEGKEEAKDP